MTVETKPLTRNDLAQFFRREDGTPDMRAIIAFENALKQILEQTAIIDQGTFITWTRDQAILVQSRALQVATGELTLDVVDPDVTLGLDDTAVTPDTYGGATMTVSFTVDAKGRMTSAAEVALSTTNVAEGANLYYTDARVRAAITGTAPIAFSAGGAISLNDTAVTPGTYGDATNVAQVTVDAKGRLTAAADVPISFPGTSGFTGGPAVYTTFEFVDGLCVSAT